MTLFDKVFQRLHIARHVTVGSHKSLLLEWSYYLALKWATRGVSVRVTRPYFTSPRPRLRRDFR